VIAPGRVSGQAASSPGSPLARLLQPRSRMSSVRTRIVVASPHAAERDTFAEWLVAGGFDPIRAATVPAAIAAMAARPFDLLIADVAWAFSQGLDAAGRPHRRQPLTPTIVIGDAPSQALVRGAMYVGRPVDRDTLVCTIAMALMDERPVRRSPRKVVDRFDAIVDGVRSHVIDVSREGLRLEIPAIRRVSLPPFFSVRVPIVGLALMVQRMWGMRRSVAASWYGAALARNSHRAEQAWRDFVEALPRSGGLSDQFQIR
jgi:CheY-like chemotaxis protein